MNKETIKQQIKRQLWDARYAVTDMERIIEGTEYDLIVNKKYRVKILLSRQSSKAEIDRHVSELAVLARIQEGKKEYAGGSQKEVRFTTDYKEVFK